MYLGPGALLGPGCLLGPYSSAGIGVVDPRVKLTPSTIKRGDRAPDLTAVLTGAAGPADLTHATQIRMLGVRGEQLVIDRTVPGTAQGVVTMPWQDPDTATAGVLGFEVEVEWVGGRKQTFPPSGLVWVHVTPDLG